MKTLWTSFKQNKFLFLFISIILLFGIFSGIFFYLKQDNALKETIASSLTNVFQENVFSLENILYHFLLLLLSILLLFCFIGLPILIFFIFLEGVALGFMIPLFFSLFKIDAFIHFLLYFLLVKFLFLFFLLFIFIKSCQFLKSYFISLRKKNYDFLKNLKYLLVLVFLILLNDCGVYFGSNRILMLLFG